jgi:hypothetical protein
MTGTNCDLFTHKSSRSYLKHLVVCLNITKLNINIYLYINIHTYINIHYILNLAASYFAQLSNSTRNVLGQDNPTSNPMAKS